jgi:uncharacterized protein RhaS with RHS repeats
MYISQDPIGLEGGFYLYSYVNDVNVWVDTLGLIDGGSYTQVRKTNVGGEVHHMPSNKSNKDSGYTKGEGPSIIMTKADHKQTASHGRRKSAQNYRATQTVLISQGKPGYAKAMEMDIKDIKSKFGNKYDKSMTEAIDYAHKHDLIAKKDANRLKKQCK